MFSLLDLLINVHASARLGQARTDPERQVEGLKAGKDLGENPCKYTRDFGIFLQDFRILRKFKGF